MLYIRAGGSLGSLGECYRQCILDVRRKHLFVCVCVFAGSLGGGGSGDSYSTVHGSNEQPQE